MREGRMARGGAPVYSSRGSNVCIDVRMCVWTLCVVAPARGRAHGDEKRPWLLYDSAALSEL